jgi:hypothetical protein
MAIQTTSAIDELRKIQEQRERLNEQEAKIRDSVKAETLAKANAAIEELNSLGYNYRLTEAGSGRGRPKMASSSAPKQQRPMSADKVCPICEFKTNPPHDARKHRSQGDNKHPFTAEELASLGLTKAS